MRSFFRKISNNNFDFELVPETLDEQKLFKENKDTETIESYYHNAVTKHLGSDANLLKVVDQSRWPNSAIVYVEFAKGFGK